MKEYEVEIGFGGFIGCSQFYTVYADSREEAEELAFQEALDDLYVESVEIVEDDEEEDEEEW